MTELLGYHFDVQFGPMWRSITPRGLERARAVGIPVSDLGEALAPRALMLRVAGTYWAQMRTGEVHCQVFEYRIELDGFLLQEASITSKKLLCSFGVKESTSAWTTNKLEKAAGFWIRDGALVLRAWEGEPEQVLADFDMWTAMDAMARHASGEQELVSSPLWAREFTAKVTPEPAKLNASFTSPSLNVAAVVTLMQR